MIDSVDIRIEWNKYFLLSELEMPAETESDTPMETNTANEAQEDIVLVSSSDAEITVVSEPSKNETTTTASIAPKNKLGKVTDLNLLPWVEKYRPAVLGDLISHQDITSTIQKFIDMDQLPHLLFYGPPGINNYYSYFSRHYLHMREFFSPKLLLVQEFALALIMKHKNFQILLGPDVTWLILHPKVWGSNPGTILIFQFV